MEVIEIAGKAVIQSNPADPMRKVRVLFYRDMIFESVGGKEKHDRY